MFDPSFVRWVDSPIATYQLETLDQLAQHIQMCDQQQFTGRLDLSIHSLRDTQWSLFFYSGCLTWVMSQVHPMRRWYRQLSRYCPAQGATGDRPHSSRSWNYDTLGALVKQRKVPKALMSAIVEGYSAEILFDIVQLWHHLRYRSHAQLIYRSIPREAVETPVVMQANQIWAQTAKTWQTWQQAGLGQWSPNLAPAIWDADELRRQTSLLAYHNLTALVDGSHTLRDLAVKLKHHLLPLTQSIVPYVRRGAIGLVEVSDSSVALPSTIAPMSAAGAVVTSADAAQAGRCVAYIDDSRFDNQAMQRIMTEAGYRLISIRDPVQALPILLEQKPDLIFLDLLMPITNGYEVCTQIRRVSLFKDLPVIIVTASDGIVDRVRAKLAGASGFISKPIDIEKVLPVLQQHLPKSGSFYPRERQTASPNLSNYPA